MNNSKQNLAIQIGRCIAKRRQEAHLTQEQVAERLGIGYEAVSRMERGITIPTVIRLVELAEIFGCGVDELLIETSTRAEEQSEQIRRMLIQLSEEDRQILMETLLRIYKRLKN